MNDLPLHAAQLLVSFLCELALHADHGLETWVEEGYTEVEELWKLSDELLVQHVEGFFGVVVFLLSLWDCLTPSNQRVSSIACKYLWQSCRIIARFGDEFVHTTPCGIVVKELPIIQSTQLNA